MPEIDCPKCRKKLPADARFCLACGAVVTEVPEKVKSGLVTAGGILTILAACLCVIGGVLALGVFLSAISYPYGYVPRGYETLAVVGFFALSW